MGTIDRNVPYCIVNGVSLKMDVYYPETAIGGQWPVVIYVHGGRFTAGDKAYGEGLRYFDDLLAKDILVVSVNYRLAPEFPFPAPVEDLKCAIRSLRANAVSYNLNPIRMGLFGTSAGAHITSLAGLAGSGAGFDNSGGYTQTSSRVQAVVSMYGPYAFTFSCKDHLVQLIFGAADCNDTAVLSAASPLSYVGGNAPPFILFHGEKDEVVRVKHSKVLFRALSDAGANVELVLVENAGHGFSSVTGPINPKKGQIVKMVVDFFVQYLK
ncbi:MAG: alpha/beta hydrolase [Chloroflexi bacterium]|nr:alpha/beta hydrolase [Chloroflexota bacterium]